MFTLDNSYIKEKKKKAMCDAGDHSQAPCWAAVFTTWLLENNYSVQAKYTDESISSGHMAIHTIWMRLGFHIHTLKEDYLITNSTFKELCGIMSVFQRYKKATHKRGTLNKIIYVIVQSAFFNK